MPTSYSGAYSIPDGIESIAGGAFSGCTGLTSVTIGNSVTSIEYNAFNGCSGLTSVTIPGSVTSIGNYAFYSCTGLTSIEIPNSVTSIGIYAFYSCTGLTSVTIPNSVTSIGNHAFCGCTGLTSVIWNAKNFADFASNNTPFYDLRSQITSFTFSNDVEHIPANLCNGMSNLTSIEIPNSVTSIGNDAFGGCTGLTSVIWNAKNCADFALNNTPFYDLRSQITSFTFSNDVEHIPANLCNGMSNLTSIEIPNSVTSIGNAAFQSCIGLTSVTIPNSVTSIGDKAFAYCSGLTSVTIPNSVTSIGRRAFSGCTGLTSVTIPNSVTSIGNNAFSGCTGLTSVTIPGSVTSIGQSAFSDCTSLTSIEIPNSVTSIGVSAFEGCSGLTSVTIPNSVTSIGYRAFRDCSGLTSITIPNSVTSIGENVFYGCSGLTSVTIGNSVTSIRESAFYKCSGLTSVTIGNSVTSIGSSAFRDCSSLTSVTIPNSVTSIGNCAFERCKGLTSVTIGNSVTSIGGSAFYECTGLTSVTIPNSVTSIGGLAFYGCTDLTSVTIEAKTPPTLGYYAFGFGYGFDIYVPCGTLEAYKTAWADYADRIRLGVEYTITGKVNDANAGSVDYPTSDCGDVVITAVPNNGYHFAQWSDGNTDNPRTIELTQDTTFTAEFAPDRVGTCGKDLALVWSYDPANKVLTIGNAGEFTENMQFGLEAPNEMEELVIGNSVTAIGSKAFAGIETLKKITIGESVKTIGEQAFYNCVNLETIFNYRPTPTNTYSNAFDGVDKFECVLYVLPNSIDMYKNASVWRDFYYTYAIGAEETTVTTNDVTVEPQDHAATLTWPTNDNAASYTIQITKDGVLFCTLVFNANGQLTGIAFAPSRDGSHHAPSALMTANGLQFTVTGLNSNTQYVYSVTAKDANDQTVATYSGVFTTTSEGIATGLEEVSSSLQGGERGRLILRDGHIYILRGEKVYSIDGQEVK